MAQKAGNIAQFIEVFKIQRGYLEGEWVPSCPDQTSHQTQPPGYLPAIPTFSIDDQFESMHWWGHAGLAGDDFQCLFPFRAKLLRAVRLAEFTSVEDFRQRLDRFPLLKGMRDGGATVSNDGKVLLVKCNGIF